MNGPKKRILVAIETLSRGGAERLLLTTLGHIDRTRFDVEVAALFGPNPLAREIRADGFTVHELGLDGPRDLVRAVAGLRRLLRDGAFDLVHTHLFSANIAGRLAAGRSTPVITTLHNPDYGQEGPDHGWGVRRLLDGSTALLCQPTMTAVSEDVRGDYRRHLCLDDVGVIHNYIDVAGFVRDLDRRCRSTERARLGIPDDALLILHAGRFHRQKAHDVLVSAFATLAGRAPHAHMVLAGHGPERVAVEAQIEAAGVADRIRLLGSVSDVEGLYAAADIFAFPSRYEAFGVALLEAMAAGLPSVVTRVGGIGEVTNEEASLFVEPDDVDGLAEGLTRLIEDEELRVRMTYGARRRATAFDVGIWLPELERLYEVA